MRESPKPPPPVNPANHYKRETESEQRARLDRRARDHGPEVPKHEEPWAHKLARDVARKAAPEKTEKSDEKK